MIEEATTNSINTTFNSCDIISACINLKKIIPLTLKFEHVKGHQDAKKSISRLSVPSQLNIRMDSLTKDLLDVLSPIDCSNLPAHRHSFMLPSYENKPVYQKFKTQLYDSIMNSKAHEY